MILSNHYEALLDACVLLPPTLCDLYLRLAEQPRLYLPRWSRQILDEVRRNQIDKLKWDSELADYWRTEVSRSFPEALVEDFESFQPQCTNHEKDRHVLAAAVRCQADSIITFNAKDFPKAALDPWGMEISSPSEFLTALYEMRPAIVISKLDDMAVDRKKDRMELLSVLYKTVPSFASRIASDLSLELVIR